MNCVSITPRIHRKVNVPICTGGTALTLDSGEVVILEFGKDLWFVKLMEKSLIKPNQCQKFGMQICNDLTDPQRNLEIEDPQRKLGIEASEDLFIPMETEGSTCGIITHLPTNDDIHDCQIIILSDEFDWDPSKNYLKFLQFRRSTGKAQLFIIPQISLR